VGAQAFAEMVALHLVRSFGARSTSISLSCLAGSSLWYQVFYLLKYIAREINYFDNQITYRFY